MEARPSLVGKEGAITPDFCLKKKQTNKVFLSNSLACSAVLIRGGKSNKNQIIKCYNTRAAMKNPSRATALLVAIVVRGASPVLASLPLLLLPPCEKPEPEPAPEELLELPLPELESEPEELLLSPEVSTGAFPLDATLPPPVTPGTDSGVLVI